MGDRTDVGGGGIATFVEPGVAREPLDLDGPAEARVAAFATACRLNALGMIQLAGSGHIGSSFSSLDIVAWLLAEELDPEDVYFSSKGHDVPGLYAALIGLGRLPFDRVRTLRRLGGLPGHPDVSTPGIAFNTGSLGMGVSKAKGLLAADRIAGRRRRVIVLTGDGELQEGQIWESLPSAARDGLDRLTVIVDHNRLQSDLPVAEVNPLDPLEDRFRAFGWHAERIDGHDLGALRRALEREVDGPRAIIAETVKSCGVPFLEPGNRPADEPYYPFHSGALAPAVYAEARDVLADRLDGQRAVLGLPPARTVDLLRDDPAPWPPGPTASTQGGGEAQRLVPAYGRALVELAVRRDDVVVLDADLMVDLALDGFRDAFPSRFLECGIAEQDMVSQASGLAAGGMLPFVHSFATFLSARPMEQAVNAASEGRKVVYVGALAGLVPAAPGHSHQGLQDIGAFSRAGAVVIAPSSERAVADAVDWLADHHGSGYLRLSSMQAPLPFAAGPLPEFGRGAVVIDSAHPGVVVLGYGPVLLGEAFRAITSDTRAAGGVRLIDLPWVNAVDRDWLHEAVRGARRVIVLDDHDVGSGLGVHVASLLAERGDGPALSVLGVTGVPECGAPAEVLAHHGLDAGSIAAALA